MPCWIPVYVKNFNKGIGSKNQGFGTILKDKPVKKKNKIPGFILFLMAGFCLIAGFSMLAKVLFPVDMGKTYLMDRLKPPAFLPGGSPQFLLGTDSVGRNFAIRLVYATQNSLLIAFLSMLISVSIGLIIGVLSGFYQGWVNHVVSFITEVRMSLPFTIIAIICAAIFGSSKVTLILIMGLTGWTGFARLVRGQIIQLREAPFIECSRSLGASDIRILAEHVIINISSPLIVMATMSLNSFIMTESGLSFLGLGIQPPDISLGKMVSEGRDYLLSNWWLTIIPSIVIVVIVLQVALVGDWLRDRLDPKLQNNS
jgi:peptide/nickel transport system permease protein